MKKRVVRLMNRESGGVNTYPTVSEMIDRNGEDELGISRAALYNALHTGKGFWENKKYRVYYETVDLGERVWK